jgi:hypothetical protein
MRALQNYYSIPLNQSYLPKPAESKNLMRFFQKKKLLPVSMAVSHFRDVGRDFTRSN